ncbi:MAG: phage tail tape measure protein [Salipiger marinus]|uniref:phage tail tape measure protein n=1 Tax=Salipiger marinus TaxID=555512 RepID=UPI0040595D80
MSTTTRQYTIRLSAAGAQQLEADLRALGTRGQRSLQMIQQAGRPASAGLRETDLAARQLRGSLAAVSQEVPALQRLARFMGTTALLGGVVAFGRGALDVGRQFQAMMNRVEAASGASQSEIDRLAAKAKDLGATTAFTAMQAAEAIETLVKNGVSVGDVMGGALDASLAFAGALGGELAPAADLVTDVMAQFSLQASELPMIADRLTGAALTSKFGFDDLRLAIAQAGGVAGATGVSIEDFLTSISATASSFASGSDAGTSFKTFLQRLVPDSDKAAASMAELGLEFFDAQGNMRSMAEIAQELQDGLAGLSDEARGEALKVIFGTDAIRTAAALAKQGADGFRDIASAMREVSAEDQAAVRLKGLDGALKELAAAWEALQLESAENGGLDLAEAAVRRLTEALRFLTENFAEVEEVAERLAQALVTYLVGKGMTLVVARGVAMKAALIEIAGAATGVGTAAGRAVAPLTRLGLAARALTGVLGGPLSLALTAASIVAFGIDTDSAADAVDRADVAARKAADALDAYQAASKRAAEEQRSLGGEVSAATQQMLSQTRAGLVQALSDAERELKAARSSMTGAFFDHDGFDDFAGRYRALFKTNLQTGAPMPGMPSNRFLTDLAKMAEQAGRLEISASTFMDSFSQVQAIGPAFAELAEQLAGILASGEGLAENDALEALRGMAEEAGIFRDELAAIDRAGGEADLRAAYADLKAAIEEATVAGTQLRAETNEGFRENVTALADVEARVTTLRDAEQEALDLSRDIASERPFDATADSAEKAAGEIERLNRAYSDHDAGKAARKGMRDLIGYAEGTDRGRGYNETLDYGRWTGGEVNLVAMTLDEVLALQDGMRTPENRALYGDGAGSSAVGRYQIVSQTLRGLMDEMGLTGSELFSPDLQDQMADRLIDRRGRDPQALRAEWQGLGRVPDGLILNAFDEGAGPRAERRAEETRLEAEAQQEKAEAMAKVVAAGREQMEQLRLEADLAGRSVEEQARLTFQYEALRRAKEAGIDPETSLAADGRVLIDVISEQAEAYGRLIAAKDADARSTEVSQERLRAAGEELEGYKTQIAGLFDNLKPGGGGWQGFLDDWANMFLDKLWQIAFDPVWDHLAQMMQGLFSGLGLGGVGLAGAGAASYSASSGALMSGGLYRDGGALPRRAGGGGFRDVPRAAGKLEGAGGKRQDNLLFWGSRGEFMQPAAAVDFYGIEFMEAIRTRRLPKFAEGGALGGMPASGGGVFPGPAPQITFIDQSGRGVDVRTEERIEGGQRQMRFVLSDAVADAITTPGGRARSTLAGLGARPQRPGR